QLVTAGEDEMRACLRAHADPVDAGRRHERAVGLDRDTEAVLVQRRDERAVELQQRLAAGADYEPARPRARRPFRRDRLRQLPGGAEFSAARAVRADEIRIAEAADRRRAVPLPA